MSARNASARVASGSPGFVVSISLRRLSASRGLPAESSSSAYWSCTSTSRVLLGESRRDREALVGLARDEQAARVEQLCLEPVRIGIARCLRVLEREIEIARAQREPRERVLAGRHARERLREGLHDRRRGVRVRLVGERLEHEREARGGIAELADERLEFRRSRASSRFERVSNTPANQNGRSSSGASSFQRAGRAQAWLRELELMRDARRALGERRLFRQQCGREELVRRGLELLALERDLAEQRVRVDLDLRVAAVRRRGGRAAGHERARRARAQKRFMTANDTPPQRVH